MTGSVLRRLVPVGRCAITYIITDKSTNAGGWGMMGLGIDGAIIVKPTVLYMILHIVGYSISHLH